MFDFLLVTAAAASLVAAVPDFICHRPRPSPLLLVSAAAARACAIMSTSDDISNAFSASADIFKTVVGVPTDADVEHIQHSVVEILQIFR